MKLKDMIIDKVTDAIAIGMQAKEAIGDEKNKLNELKEQKEEQKRQEEERQKQEAAIKMKKTLKWAIPAVCALIVVGGVMSMFEGDVPKAPSQSQTQSENTSANQTNQTNQTDQIDQTDQTDTPAPAVTLDAELKASYIDVGQGDAIFIELPNEEAMLIDAGNTSDGNDIVSYIRNEGFSKVDYLIATHPHSDHIGGMPQVIANLDIGKIYMPKVSNTTNVFDNLLTAIESKGLTINTAKAGINILKTGNLSVDILAPVGESYSDLNNYSAVIKIVYGSNTFLFMGDAEKLSEGQITANVNADVLKVGHHGSDYSSGASFINAVSPKYSIIMVGAGNQYGHPSSETVNALIGAGSKVYRTDLDGTIVFTSDGTTITVSKSPATTNAVVIPPTQHETASTPPETPPTQTNTSNATVYITETGTKYHSYGCQYLSKSCIATTLQQAKANGLTPCSKCNPPQ